MTINSLSVLVKSLYSSIPCYFVVTSFPVVSFVHSFYLQHGKEKKGRVETNFVSDVSDGAPNSWTHPRYNHWERPLDE